MAIISAGIGALSWVSSCFCESRKLPRYDGGYPDAISRSSEFLRSFSSPSRMRPFTVPSGRHAADGMNQALARTDLAPDIETYPKLVEREEITLRQKPLCSLPLLARTVMTGQ